MELSDFDIDEELVESITSFYSMKATRQLRTRRQIFTDAITMFYSIKKACEIYHDDPKRVVSHLRRYLPNKVFYGNDINYVYYPEMVVALKRVLPEDFQTSKKLLLMAYIARKIAKSRKQRGELWFYHRYDLIQFLYDLQLKSRVFLEIGGKKASVDIDRKTLYLIEDMDSYDKETIERIKKLNAVLVLILVGDSEIVVLSPENIDLGDLMSDLESLSKTKKVLFEPDRKTLKRLAEIILGDLAERGTGEHRLGALMYSLANTEISLQNFFGELGIKMDLSRPLYEITLDYLFLLVGAYSALTLHSSMIASPEEPLAPKDFREDYDAKPIITAIKLSQILEIPIETWPASSRVVMGLFSIKQKAIELDPKPNIEIKAKKGYIRILAIDLDTEVLIVEDVGAPCRDPRFILDGEVLKAKCTPWATQIVIAEYSTIKKGMLFTGLDIKNRLPLEFQWGDLRKKVYASLDEFLALLSYPYDEIRVRLLSPEKIELYRRGIDVWQITLYVSDNKTIELYGDEIDYDQLIDIARAIFSGSDWKKYCSLRLINVVSRA